MESFTRYGLVAVFAVSGSMVFLVHQLHKRLVSNFMKKFELEIRGNSEKQEKKKVRFAERVIEVPIVKMNKNKGYYIGESEWVRKTMEIQRWKSTSKLEDIMPPNRAVLYRGIVKHRALNYKFRF